MSESTKNKILDTFSSNLNIYKIDVEDQSYRHAGHVKENSGGHYRALIVSNDFMSLSLIDRHKRVYSLLNKLMESEIHALSMETLTEEEFSSRSSGAAS